MTYGPRWARPVIAVDQIFSRPVLPRRQYM